MKVVLQRVTQASVKVNAEIIGEIGEGLLLLAGFAQTDQESQLKPMAQKILNMRIFANEKGKFDRSVQDVQGGILIIPQFTLFADTDKGRRPEFFGAMEPVAAKKFFLQFIEVFKNLSPLRVEQGEFGADMKVSLLNDGPVTIIIEN